MASLRAGPGRGVRPGGWPACQVYGPPYEPATTPDEAFSAMLMGKLCHAYGQAARGGAEVKVSESDQDAGVVRAEADGLIPHGLFVVERRLPKINDHQLTVLQATLTSAATRFSTRGDGVRLVGSIFLARQERLLSLFTAESMEAVRAVNEASLVPFASIEPAVQLPGPDES